MVTLSGTALLAPGAAFTLQSLSARPVTRAEADAAQAAHKHAVDDDVAKARSAPGLQTRDNGRGRVRGQILEIVKRLRILKQMYANDPKGMAKALAGVFRELRAAIKEYKKLLKDELGMSADAAATVVPPEGAAPAAAEADVPKDDSAKPDPGIVTYDEINAGLKKSLGNEGLDFLKEVQAMVHEIDEKFLTPTRIQMLGRKRDKDTDDAFEDVDKEMKDLKQDIRDLQGDIHNAAPEAGMTLSKVA